MGVQLSQIIPTGLLAVSKSARRYKAPHIQLVSILKDITDTMAKVWGGNVCSSNEQLYSCRAVPEAHEAAPWRRPKTGMLRGPLLRLGSASRALGAALSG